MDRLPTYQTYFGNLPYCGGFSSPCRTRASGAPAGEHGDGALLDAGHQGYLAGLHQPRQVTPLDPVGVILDPTRRRAA